ncbi:MAG: nucleotidyltransferase domain-containing protein, partial [Candidatus Altiarchaeota archaeon]|nr:nucleotidyltransferase domain-containing protein [Candidatus Altiarchaeota archaeon]
LSVRKTAKELNLSPGHVSRFIKILKKEEIITAGKVDLNNPLVKALKILINIKTIEDTIPAITRNIPGINGVGVYGSWSNGMNYDDSDLDLWIKIDEPPERRLLANQGGVIRERLKVDVSLLVLTPDKLKRLKNSDKVFYYALVNSITLWGEPVD